MTFYDVAVCSRSFSCNEVLRQYIESKYAKVKFNDQGLSLKGDGLVDFLSDAKMAIIALEPVDNSVLKKLPHLEVVGKYGVGINNLSLQAFIDCGIKLGWTPGVNKRAVSELTLSMILSSLRRTYYANSEVKADRWRQIVGENLTGKTVGIIGIGNVGKDLVKLLKPFDCKILSYDIKNYDEFCNQFGVISTTFDELLTNSDVICVHVPLNESTKDLLNSNHLPILKKGVVLINTARGGIINEDFLFKGLESGHISSAAFDVLVSEPPDNFELINHPNFFITPHVGGSSREAIIAMGKAAVDCLESATIPSLSLGE